MRSPTALLIAGVLLLGAAAPALADEGDDDRKEREGERHDGDDHKSRFDHRGDKWILHDDQIAVWFHQGGHGKAKPELRVAWNGTDNETAGYRVKINRICEVDESLRCTGKYPRVNLARSDDWNVVTSRVNDSLTLTMVRADAQAIVTLVWHLDTSTHVVKYDLLVENWRWENATHKLALEQVVLGKNLRNTTGARVDVEDSGFIRWATTASAAYGPNDTRTLGVESLVKSLHGEDEEDDDDHPETTGARLTLVFNGTGGYQSLDYDPEFAIASSGGAAPVPVPGLVAGVLAVAVAALVLRRR
jgi:hypothetical protein